LRFERLDCERTVYELPIFHAEEENGTPSTELGVRSILNVAACGANFFMPETVKIKPPILL
jgi:hypothetical protein